MTSRSRATALPTCSRPAPSAGCAASLPTGPCRPCRDAESGGPGKLRGRERRLALELDPEGVDLRARRLGDRELGAGRVEDAGDPGGLSRLHAERNDVLDLEAPRVADPD